MLPHKHFVYGIVFSLILVIIMPQIGFIGVSLIVLSGVLIDFDHYIYYLLKKRDFSLINAFNSFRTNRKKFLSLPLEKRAQYHGGLCVFHGFESLIIALILTFLISEYFGFVFIGMASHLFMDYIEQWPYLGRIDRISSAYDFLKFRKLKDINEI